MNDVVDDPEPGPGAVMTADVAADGAPASPDARERHPGDWTQGRGATDVDGDAAADDVPRRSFATVGRRALLRIVRRPSRWIEAPWPASRIIRVVTAVVVVGAATLAAVQAIHPELVFRNNTPAGGDMGAHVMGPAYLRDHLLPNLQLSGWSNYWYAGFPMYRFYMVVPALLIVLLNVALPYGIAFKIVAVLGVVTLPFCCFAFGRLARFRYPMPELFALAGLLFLFDESFSIYGGNVKSTMAGEFSFSIALSLAVLGLGLFANGLHTGKYRNWTAIVLALACLSHGIVLIFVLVGALLLWLIWMDRTRFVYGLTMGLTALLLAAFWVVPFLFNHDYMTDMKYGFRPAGSEDSFWDMFFPLTTFFDVLITTFAVIGFVSSIVRRHLNGAWLGIACLAFVAGVYVTRDSLPLIGLLWNPRLLPFVYLLRYLLMMIGIVETAYFVVRGIRGQRVLTGRPALVTGTAVAAVVGVAILAIELMFFRIMPGAEMRMHNGKSVYQWGPISLTATSTDALSDAWPQYNFKGYEDKSAYGEYRALVKTMEGLGLDPAHGCGRALWENNGENGKYGTTMALMLLPHWTDGCIASMEGLFFEASGTTPYHFVTAAAMSQQSSNPVRQLRYDNNNAAIGVPYLQTLGVKYVMVFTEAARNQADSQPELTKVASSGPWNIYAVAGTDIVEPLAFQPVVVNGRSGDARERNLELGMSWFQHRDEWAAMPADDGPDGWQRIDVAPDLSRRQDDRVDIVQPVQPIQQVPLTPVTISNVDLDQQELSFTVDRVGVPVLVKMSYFPNWDVSGADGPYRIAPNLMVVVPTSTEVRFTYERSGLDMLAYVMTVAGLVLLGVWRWRGDVGHRNEEPFAAAGSRSTADADADDSTPAGWRELESRTLLVEPTRRQDEEFARTAIHPDDGLDLPREESLDESLDRDPRWDTARAADSAVWADDLDGTPGDVWGDPSWGDSSAGPSPTSSAPPPSSQPVAGDRPRPFDRTE